MAKNLMSKITSANPTIKLCRLDASFMFQTHGLNTFIGREAHLQFLENETLLRMLAYRYGDDLFS